MNIPKKIIFIIFIISSLFADIRVIDSNNEFFIETLKGEVKTYFSARDLVSILSARLYENQERKKLVLYISGKRIKVSAGTSYLVIDDDSYQMIDVVEEYNNDFYLPAEQFFNILKKTTLPGLVYDNRRETLNIDIVRYNINAVKIEKKSNGTIVRIQTQKSFSDRNISSFINKHGWFYITIRK